MPQGVYVFQPCVTTVPCASFTAISANGGPCVALALQQLQKDY